MRVFELYFNPKAKEDKIFNSFLFEPENILERKLGGLYLAGELFHVLPQNIQLLERISSAIKKEYYRVSERSPETALKESLKKANEFLSGEAERGNVNWLGNLHFAALSLSDFNLHFTKTGDFKIFLLRGKQAFDIGKNLEIEGLEPYPLKVFGNIVSGKLSEEDRIIVQSKDIYDFFSQQNILTEISQLEEIKDQKLKNIVKNKENLLGKTSGICLLIDFKKEGAKVKEKRLRLSSAERLTFRKIIHFRKISFPIPKIKISPLKFPELKFPKLKFPSLQKIFIFQKGVKISENFKKNFIIISALIFLLLIGNFIFSLEKERGEKKAHMILEEITVKIDSAEKAFLLQDTKRANIIYQEILKEISPYVKRGEILKEEFLKLQKEVEEKLFIVNKLQRVSEPEMLFDFKNVNFIPQKIVLAEKAIYFFSPVESSLYQFSILEKRGDFIESNQKFSLGVPMGNERVLFYIRPDKIFLLKNREFEKEILLKIPYPDFHFTSLAPYTFNLYFLDGKSGEIVRFTFEEQKEEIPGILWLHPLTKKVKGGKSLTVDGTLWVLNEDNSLDKFEGGKLREKITFNFYPPPKNFTKIFTSSAHSYLYLLEPVQKRIVIVTKSGQIIKQFQSEKFDNLKDFTVSRDGKTIYVLNGLKVYQIKL